MREKIEGDNNYYISAAWFRLAVQTCVGTQRMAIWRNRKMKYTPCSEGVVARREWPGSFQPLWCQQAAWLRQSSELLARTVRTELSTRRSIYSTVRVVYVYCTSIKKKKRNQRG